MQDKHVLIVHKNEDRDIFINKCALPKTVIHVGNNPEKDDKVLPASMGFPGIFATWVLENWDNLPEYLITSQANPDDHVHRMDLAIQSTLTDEYGNFGFGRAYMNQYTIGWVRVLPLIDFAEEFGLRYINSRNTKKQIFFLYPGDHFYITKNNIHRKGKSFFEKLLFFDKTENYFNFIKNLNYPSWFYKSINLVYPELSHLTMDQKLEKLIGPIEGRTHGYLGQITEYIFPLLFMSEEVISQLNKSQAFLGNKFYFNTKDSKYNSKKKITLFPYQNDDYESIWNMRLLENNWFDWECEKYLAWRKTLIENMFMEGYRNNFNAYELLDFHKKIGYKHVSF